MGQPVLVEIYFICYNDIDILQVEVEGPFWAGCEPISNPNQSPAFVAPIPEIQEVTYFTSHRKFEINPMRKGLMSTFLH